MISSNRFIDCLTRKGFETFLGVPCSMLKPLINNVINRDDTDYFAANNEGEAVAVAAGAYLAGQKAVVMLQNSGLGNAVNPLSSLNFVFRIPVLLIVSWRGEPGNEDAPQHELMGRITKDQLSLLQIEHDTFPESDEQVEPKIQRAVEYLEQTSLPYALVMSKGSVLGYDLKTKNRNVSGHMVRASNIKPLSESILLRHEAIAIVAEAAGDDALMVATTGKTGRELFAYKDRSNYFYTVGSMGCASSIGLGVALYQSSIPVIVLDGDGAVLMRLEAMVSIGHHRPSNFIHVILDNGAYDSTGGQQTLSAGVQFPELAMACGYQTALSVNKSGDLSAAIAAAVSATGPHLIHVKIRLGSAQNIPRPTLSPPEIASRFRKTVQRYIKHGD